MLGRLGPCIDRTMSIIRIIVISAFASRKKLNECLEVGKNERPKVNVGVKGP